MEHPTLTILVLCLLTASTVTACLGDEQSVELRRTCETCVTLSSAATQALPINPSSMTITQTLHSLCKAVFSSSDKLDSCMHAADDIINLWGLEVDHPNWIHEDYSARSLCSTLGACEVPCCLTASRPEQVHIQQNRDSTGVFVMWVTADKALEPVVEYAVGRSPSNSDEQASSDYTTISATRHTYSAGGWCGQIYQALLPDMKPSTKYHYRVGDAKVKHHNDSAWSDFFEFKSAPPINATSAIDEWTIATFGDMGQSSLAKQVLKPLEKLLADGKIDMTLILGDISYADGDQALWDSWMRFMEPVAANMLVNPVVGNHERFLDFAAYLNRYVIPGDRTLQGSEMFYSFDYGNIHFVVYTLEQTDTLQPGAPQIEFLRQDLMKANSRRDDIPWIVACGHRPLYCVANGSPCISAAEEYRKLLEPTFEEFHVDLVLQAHMHSYDRTYPVFNSKLGPPSADPYLDPIYPTYALIGTGGRGNGTSWMNPVPEYSASHISAVGYTLLRTNGRKQLMFEFYDQDNTLRDSFNITRTKPAMLM